MRWPIERKLLLGLGIAVFVLAGLGAIAYFEVQSFVETSDWLIHTHLVIEATQAARTGLDDAEAAVRGYLLTKDETYLAPYELVRARIPGAIDHLRILTRDNAAQQHRVVQLKPQVDEEMATLERAVAGVKSGSLSTSDELKLLDRDQKLISSIRNVLREERLQENQLLLIRDQAWRRQLTRAITMAAALGLLNLVLLASVYFVFKRDLTERRRAESALATGEERLRLLISSVKDYAFFMLDPEGNVATWNEGAAIIKGYSAQEIIGKPFATFFPEEERRGGNPEAALRVAAEKGSVEIKGWRLRQDGSRFWTDAITSAIRDSEGKLLGFSEVARDLTDKKLAEESLRSSESRLAAILDGSPSVIFVKDTEGRYTLVNRRFEDAFQMPREQVLGKTDFDLFRKDNAQQFRDHDAKAIAAGRTVEFEEEILQKGSLHTYLAARVPLLGGDHKPYAICGVLTDITERKASEKEIQRLNRALQDRVIDHSVQLMQAADELKIERGQRESAEERERSAHDSLRALMLSSPAPMWAYDLETMALLDSNDAALSLHNVKRDQIPTLRMSDLYESAGLAALEQRMSGASLDAEQSTLCQPRTAGGASLGRALLARKVEWEGRNAALVIALKEANGSNLQDISTALEAAGS